MSSSVSTTCSRKKPIWFIQDFCVLSDFPVQVLNKICGIYYFSYFQRELEENSQVIPVVSPGAYGVRILCSPFPFQIVKFCGCNLFIGCIIDILHIRRKHFLVLINDIFTGVSDLVYHTDLGG